MKTARGPSPARARSAPAFAVALVTALGLACALEPPALAHDKRVCVEASDQGQGYRLDGKLNAARDRLLLCADASCPSIVRAACARWLVDLEAQIPSIILVARDGAGNDVLGVQVSIDGGPPADAVSGRPVSLDPGTHNLRFAAPGGGTVDRVVVLAEGEQRRLIEAAFPSRAASPPPPTPAALPVAPAAAPSPPSRVPPAAWGFAIAGLAAWTAFGVFALDGHLEFESAASTCNERCPPERYASINTKFVVADVALGAALVTSGIAAVLFLTRPSRPMTRTTGATGTVFSF